MIEKILEPILAPFRFLREKVFGIKTAPMRLQGEIMRAKSSVGTVKSDFAGYSQDIKGVQGKAQSLQGKAQGMQQQGMQQQQAVGMGGQGQKKMGFFAKLFGGGRKCPSCNQKMHASWTECPFCGWGKQGGQGQGGNQGGQMPNFNGPGMNAPMPSGGGKQHTMALDLGAPMVPAPQSDSFVGWFIPLEGGQTGELFQIKGRTTIGKSPDCQIVLNDPSISGHHAEFVPTPGGFRLNDLGSTNGTYVNDKRVQSHDLIDNDNVKLGKVNFKYKSVV